MGKNKFLDDILREYYNYTSIDNSQKDIIGGSPGSNNEYEKIGLAVANTNSLENSDRGVSPKNEEKENETIKIISSALAGILPNPTVGKSNNETAEIISSALAGILPNPTVGKSNNETAEIISSALVDMVSKPNLTNPKHDIPVSKPILPNPDDCKSLIGMANKLSKTLRNMKTNCESLIGMANNLSQKLKEILSKKPEEPKEDEEPEEPEEPKEWNDKNKGKLILGKIGEKGAVILDIESINKGHIDDKNNNLKDKDIEIYFNK